MVQNIALRVFCYTHIKTKKNHVYIVFERRFIARSQSPGKCDEWMISRSYIKIK